MKLSLPQISFSSGKRVRQGFTLSLVAFYSMVEFLPMDMRPYLLGQYPSLMETSIPINATKPENHPLRTASLQFLQYVVINSSVV